ncbi:hypothetical protein [Staphylococcus simulans]|uniref:hypothetical protein n=1 Tax=Staphylococcus simulans TaxID=1286 RepID=UPI00399AC647
MRYKIKEQDLLESFKLHYPDYDFKEGRLLVGQHKRDNLEIYYLGEDFFAVMTVDFFSFNFLEIVILEKNAIDEISLKDGMIYRKMFVKVGDKTLKYSTSRFLLTDFQQDHYNKFIDGQKERVIYKDGKFL